MKAALAAWAVLLPASAALAGFPYRFTLVAQGSPEPGYTSYLVRISDAKWDALEVHITGGLFQVTRLLPTPVPPEGYHKTLWADEWVSGLEDAERAADTHFQGRAEDYLLVANLDEDQTLGTVRDGDYRWGPGTRLDGQLAVETARQTADPWDLCQVVVEDGTMFVGDWTIHPPGGPPVGITWPGCGPDPRPYAHADSGGPYAVGPGGSVRLDATDSFCGPSCCDVFFRWHRDGISGDVIAGGRDPTVSYHYLVDTLGMGIGEHTLYLEVEAACPDAGTDRDYSPATLVIVPEPFSAVLTLAAAVLSLAILTRRRPPRSRPRRA